VTTTDDQIDPVVERQRRGDGWRWLANHRKWDDSPFHRRAAEYLDWLFMGIYHIEPEIKRALAKGEWNDDLSVSVTLYGGRDFATYDAGLLTRIVVGAHDFCLRVSLSPSGPRYIRIMIWPRERTGGIMGRHPTLEDHLNLMSRIEPLGSL
jgi:hypothetical protein